MPSREFSTKSREFAGNLLMPMGAPVMGAGYNPPFWAALMFVLGALNIIIAVTLPFGVWAWFISGGRHRRQDRGLPRAIRDFPRAGSLRGAAAGGPRDPVE